MTPVGRFTQVLGTRTSITIVVATVTTALSGVFTFGHASSVVTFIVSAICLAALASLVSDGTEQLGTRLGSGATGVLQSALGNLPELFISIFALRAGLLFVVQAALVGSILANSLLVLGLAFLFGGWRNGVQRFSAETPQIIVIMTVLAVAAVAIPTVAQQSHTPASTHEEALSVVVAIVLLIIFAGSVTFIVRGGSLGVTTPLQAEGKSWPTWLAGVVLAFAGVGAAFVSSWFVDALVPATSSLGISQGFTGLVIIAIAGNAVENVVGIRFALRDQVDLAISVILNSSLQVAVALIPALVLLSLVIGGTHLTLVLSPLLVVSLAVTTVLSAFIVFDGESTWVEGLALIGLYVIVAASFWWS